MAVFHADVVAEILSRLPVKALLRFRSVSKIWCALIDSDHFIKSHLHRSIENKNNRKFILSRCGFQSISLDFDSMDVVAEAIGNPLVTDSPILDVRCCNGLLLLWTLGNDSAIWNPSTLKCQTLPPRQQSLLISLNVGFGYDAVNDDYKVLSLSQMKSPQVFVSDVKVYSLKSNSWRTRKDFPYFLRCSDGGVLAQGALHWFLDEGDDETHFGYGSIVAFDLATEETRLVSLPEEVAGGFDVSMDLLELEGCPCVVAYLRSGRYDQEFLGVWVLKDYGVGESWNKLLSESQLSVMGSFLEVFPLAYSKNGREVLLLLDNKQFIWLDLNHNAVRKVEVQGLPRYVEAKVFVESLVPLCSGGKTNPEEQHIEDKKIEMKRA